MIPQRGVEQRWNRGGTTRVRVCGRKNKNRGRTELESPEYTADKRGTEVNSSRTTRVRVRGRKNKNRGRTEIESPEYTADKRGTEGNSSRTTRVRVRGRKNKNRGRTEIESPEYTADKRGDRGEQQSHHQSKSMPQKVPPTIDLSEPLVKYNN
jgi:hypothetical protein